MSPKAVKYLLIFVPLFLVFLLIQSYFWVPSYEEQTKGNPKRLVQFIEASIGEPTLLNPILSTDSASAEIEEKVFEGLLDRDEDLNLRGRLARAWKLYEEAYFFVNESYKNPYLNKVLTPEEVVSFILKKKESIPSLRTIESVSIIQSNPYKKEVQIKDKKILLEITPPPKIKLVLKKVDPEIFKKLEAILGKGYFETFAYWNYVKAHKKIGFLDLKKFLPPTTHNPVIIFYLRKNVLFHDGHPFDASDVKFTYDAIMDPKNISPRVSDFEPVKEVKVIDKYTVKVVYKRLYSPALASWTIGILPEHLLNKKMLEEEAKRLGRDPKSFSIRDSSFNRHPIGCGPFKFKEWKTGQYIVLERFDKYFEGPPNYKEFIMRIIPDPLTQEMEFYAGTIDVYSVQPHQVDRFKKDKRWQVFSGPSFGYTYIGYNMRREPFKDRRVRVALGMAINVDKIIKYVLHGQGERITGPFVKQTPYYDHSVPPLPYSPEKALKLLEEAGWKRGKDGWLRKNGKKLQFTLITNSGNDIRRAILAIVQDCWRKIGVDVRTDILEWSVFIQERINKLDFDAVILGWIMGIEPDLYQIWHSSQTHPYELNFVGFKNKEADRLILKIRQEYDKQKQIEYCHKLHRIIAHEQPYTFLFTRKWTVALDKRIVIKEVDENGKIIYKKITPTKTGNYAFYFNKWIKLPYVPSFSEE